MLVLTLKSGQSVTIGDDIKVTFLRRTGTDSVNIGFDAPKDIPVLRLNAKCKVKKD